MTHVPTVFVFASTLTGHIGIEVIRMTRYAIDISVDSINNRNMKVTR